MSTSVAVLADGLRKRYGNVPALDGFSLSVAAGTVCGLLGPNGAGKTTAVRILGTLVAADGGRAEVAGFDVARQPADVRERIGLINQAVTIDEMLTGRENLRMWGRLFHLSKSAARERADELLTRFGLTEAADRQVKKYSGGMKRRLDLAAGLILAPPVLFLDEPSTGLDPRNRNEVWSSIRALVADGTTVLLTTQYLDEADQLADQIAVVDHGRVIAEGPPDELKARIGGEQLDIVVRRPRDSPLPETTMEKASVLLTEISGGGSPEIDPDRGWLSVPVTDRVAALTEAVRAFADAGIEVADLGLRRPSLDEVFLRLTGHRTHDEPLANDPEVNA